MKIYLSIILVLIAGYAAVGQQTPKAGEPQVSQQLDGKLTQQQMHDLGIRYYRDNDFKSAIPFLEQAILADTSDKEAWSYLGMSYAKTDRMDEAVQTFRRAADFPSRALVKHKTYFKFISMPEIEPPARARSVFKDFKFTFAVEFLATGKIGTFVPIDKMPTEWIEPAANVIRNIKFKPEQILEFPVTTVGIFVVEARHGI